MSFGSYSVAKYDTTDEKVGQQLINSFNELYNLKEVFEYNLNLIKNTKGKKNLLSYFPSYMGQWWETGKITNKKGKTATHKVRKGDVLDEKGPGREQVRQVIEKAIKSIGSSTFSDSDKEKINNDLKDVLTKGASFTLRAMYAMALPDPTNPEYKPYQNLYNEITKMVKSGDSRFGDFISSLMDAYGYTDLAGEIADTIFNQQNWNGVLDDYTKGAGYFKVNGPRAGLAAEIEALFIQQLKGFENVMRPDTNPKPDIVMTYGVSIPEAAGILGNIDGVATREKHVQAAQNLYDHLKKASDTYLVYTSAKNYTLNQKFEQGYTKDAQRGFTADKDIKLATWEEMLDTAHLRSNDLIRSVMQLIPGAIGEGRDEEVSNMFARAIAGALFDDFDVRGHVPETGAKAIHLLYLNGVYIPLSFYFDKLYHAFYEASAEFDRNSLIDVRIKYPDSIAFPKVWPEETGGTAAADGSSPDPSINESAWRAANPGQSPWAYQRGIALTQTTISFKFWAKFKKDMQDIEFTL